MRRTAALIAGGGPAGAATAIMLAQNGARPLLIERARDVGDALCGGFLSWRTLETLETLGIDPDLPGGHPISRLRLFSETRSGEASLPARAIGVSRHRLDKVLLDTAARTGVAIERGVAIRSATPELVMLADGGEIACESLFLATGKHDCRGLARPKPDLDEDVALGVRLRIAPAPKLTALLDGAIELHLFRGGYAGLLLQEDGSANLCMAVRKSRLSEADGDPWALFDALADHSAALADRLQFADRGARIDAIGHVPYGWHATEGVSGLFRIGDQAAVIPSLAGEGIGIALASGVAAARAHAAGGPAAAIAFQRAFAGRAGRPLRVAGLIRDGAEARFGRKLAPGLLGALPWLAAPLARLTRIDP